MDTTFHSGGNSTVNVHDVQQIQVSANSAVMNSGELIYWQSLVFLGREGLELGKVTVFLEDPAAALPIGDQPPYWGNELAGNTDLDGASPF
ncbi:MAG: hypothetical protein KDI54_17025 [Gammaproteobacteria bacterium]|nr:hypothetical protein [Gammaproteobacteria bacterium]